MTDAKEQAAATKSDYEKFMERAEIAAAKVSTVNSFEEAVMLIRPSIHFWSELRVWI